MPCFIITSAGGGALVGLAFLFKPSSGRQIAPKSSFSLLTALQVGIENAVRHGRQKRENEDGNQSTA